MNPLTTDYVAGSEELITANPVKIAETPIRIEKLTIRKNKKQNLSPSWGYVLSVLRGKLRITFADYRDVEMKAGKMLYLPVDTPFTCYSESCAEVLLFPLRGNIRFSDNYTLEDLRAERGNELPLNKKSVEPLFLSFNKLMKSYMTLLHDYHPFEASGFCFHSSKVQELLHILYTSYAVKEVLRFFQYAIGKVTSFEEFVLSNHGNYKTVYDLAKAMGYSKSGFEKHFKQVFNVSPYKWMREQKARKILFEIRTSDKSLREISEKFGFHNISNFYSFLSDFTDRTPLEVKTLSRRNFEP